MMFIDALKKIVVSFVFYVCASTRTITDVAMQSKTDVLNIYKMTGALAFHVD